MPPSVVYRTVVSEVSGEGAGKPVATFYDDGDTLVYVDGDSEQAQSWEDAIDEADGVSPGARVGSLVGSAVYLAIGPTERIPLIRLTKFNPNHDRAGRFSSGGGGGAAGGMSLKSVGSADLGAGLDFLDEDFQLPGEETVHAPAHAAPAAAPAPAPTMGAHYGEVSANYEKIAMSVHDHLGTGGQPEVAPGLKLVGGYTTATATAATLETAHGNKVLMHQEHSSGKLSFELEGMTSLGPPHSGGEIKVTGNAAGTTDFVTPTSSQLHLGDKIYGGEMPKPGDFVNGHAVTSTVKSDTGTVHVATVNGQYFTVTPSTGASAYITAFRNKASFEGTATSTHMVSTAGEIAGGVKASKPAAEPGGVAPKYKVPETPPIKATVGAPQPVGATPAQRAAVMAEGKGVVKAGTKVTGHDALVPGEALPLAGGKKGPNVLAVHDVAGATHRAIALSNGKVIEVSNATGKVTGVYTKAQLKGLEPKGSIDLTVGEKQNAMKGAVEPQAGMKVKQSNGQETTADYVHKNSAGGFNVHLANGQWATLTPSKNLYQKEHAMSSQYKDTGKPKHLMSADEKKAATLAQEKAAAQKAQQAEYAQKQQEAQAKAAAEKMKAHADAVEAQKAGVAQQGAAKVGAFALEETHSAWPINSKATASGQLAEVMKAGKGGYVEGDQLTQWIRKGTAQHAGSSSQLRFAEEALMSGEKVDDIGHHGKVTHEQMIQHYGNETLMKAEAMLKAQYMAPLKVPTKTLTRGTAIPVTMAEAIHGTHEIPAQIQVGHIVSMVPSSFTGNGHTASSFGGSSYSNKKSKYGKATQITYTIEPGTKAKSYRNPNGYGGEDEYIVGGNFEITKVSQINDHHLGVTIRQVGVLPQQTMPEQLPPPSA